MTNETKDLIEEWIVDEIQESGDMDDGEAKSKKTANIIGMINAYKDLQETEAKTIDMEEKRRLEEKKTEETLDIERKKLRFNWPEFLLKGAGVAAMFVSSIFVDIAMQERNLKFEESGYFKSTTIKSFKPLIRDWTRRLHR